MTLFSAAEGAKICGGLLIGPDVEISRRWVCDSREASEGCAFVAMKGSSSDGHLYMGEAVERGAELVLAEAGEVERQALAQKYGGVSFIAVRETQRALCELAKEYLRRVSPKTAAITGSVGKTTTRELTAAALREKYRVHSAIRSFNTLTGCSLTILAMPEETDVLVLELGTNHFGEISEMVANFPPELAVITEVAPCHLEGFGSVEGVLCAKTEICESERLDAAIYNCDNGLLKNYFAHAGMNIAKTSVGRSPEAAVRIGRVAVALGEDGARTEAEISAGGEKITLSSALFGFQHSYNMAYAFAAAVRLGLSPHEAARGIAKTSPLSGRGVCRRTAPRGWLVDEAYNANPASMRAAILNARAAAGNLGLRKCAILAGMKELGRDGAEWHKKIIEELADFDEVSLLGEEWRECGELPEGMRLFASLDELFGAIDVDASDGRIILVKGSNSYGLKRVAEAFPEYRASDGKV